MRTTPGTVVAALAIIGLLLPSLRSLGRVHEYWHAARVSRFNLQRQLRASKRLPLRTDAPALEIRQGRIELAEVAVAGSLSSTSACVEAGQRIAIVGPNGAGKSTLLAAVARLIEVDHGQVLIDGEDVARASLASLRSGIGIVSPDLPLLRGSVEYNIRYRQRQADAEALERVARWCDLERLYAELPQGRATRLTEGGGNLSHGQRARIALARALYGDPRILLLDEAEAHLDPEAGRLLERILLDYPGTILLVTHRTPLLSKVDRVWELRDGILSELGPEGVAGQEALRTHPALAVVS
jgi:ABC-type multidrug transport system fused ATPase/permease subunit